MERGFGVNSHKGACVFPLLGHLAVKLTNFLLLKNLRIVE